MKKFLVLAAAVLMMTPAFAKAAVTIGETAPEFTLPAADGSEVNLADYKGKVVVLEWFNKGCPFVRKHYDSGNMQKLQKDYAEKDVVWLTILSSAEGMQGHETPEEAIMTRDAAGAAPTHILLDPEGTVGKMYDAKTTPHMYVINAEGTLVYAGAIDDNPSADPADIEGAKNYVQLALDAVLAGEPVAEASTKAYGCSIKYKN